MSHAIQALFVKYGHILTCMDIALKRTNLNYDTKLELLKNAVIERIYVG